MAGTVTSSRGTDVNFYYTYRNSNTGGLLRSGIFDVSKAYSSGWQPCLQQTTSFRSGRSFLKALTDPQQIIADEDLSDRVSDRSDVLMKQETNDARKSQTYDHGHPFSTFKMEREMTNVNLASKDGKVSYYGPLGIYTNGASSVMDGRANLTTGPNIATGNWSAIDQTKGAKAISKTIPTLPVSGVAAFLGELHEGLPQLIGHSLLFKERAHAFHAAGDEYLNVQFGWKPFVSDVKKFAKAFTNAHAILKKYREESGKALRRKYSFPATRSTHLYPELFMDWGAVKPENVFRFPCADPSIPGGTFPSLDIDALFRLGASASFHGSIVSTEKYYFTGAYSYLLSEDDSFFGRMERYAQLANKLVGIRFTPDVLWELTPWSWLADWEANIGVNITNATALGQDNLVLRWGYLMRKTTLKHYASSSLLTSYSGWSGSIHNSFKFTSKERVRATPFGFGLNPGGFTDHQWSILGALGLTKAPKSLF